jgi:hypothetical protein
LPWIEQDDLYRRIDLEKPWNSPENIWLAQNMPEMFAYPSEWHKGQTITNYLAVVGEETLWPVRRKLPREEVSDGTSNTIHIVENYGANIHWMSPTDLPFAPRSFQLHDPQGISSRYKIPAVAMLDGTVRSCTGKVSPNVIRALLTANGGEKVQPGEEGGWHLIEDGRQRELRDE